jgi:heme exporter protein A
MIARSLATFPPLMPETAPADPTSRAFSGRELACRRGERLVFSGLSFALPPGGALVLTGPNGSGKSSLLRLMAGLSRPDAGALSWDGIPVSNDPVAHRARLHFIGHQDAVKPALAVGETLRFWAGMHGGAAVAAALAHFRLEAVADWPCRHLSAGQRRRLALARLLASPVLLWLLDEPTTGLDAEAQADLLGAIAGYRRNGGRLVLSTHAQLAIADATVLSLADFAPRSARPEEAQRALSGYE